MQDEVKKEIELGRAVAMVIVQPADFDKKYFERLIASDPFDPDPDEVGTAYVEQSDFRGFHDKVKDHRFEIVSTEFKDTGESQEISGFYVGVIGSILTSMQADRLYQLLLKICEYDLALNVRYEGVQTRA